MTFAPEPPFRHGTPETTAVVLVNLGTPDAPTPAALRRYLAQFLGDPRVVEIPRALWWLILHGVILRVRPAKSAKKYESISMPEGSPLHGVSARPATLLRGYLGERGHGVVVRHAMRYGNPSVASVMNELKAAGAQPRAAAADVPAVLRPHHRPAPGRRGRRLGGAVRSCPSFVSSTAITTTPATSTRLRSACWSTGRRTAAASGW